MEQAQALDASGSPMRLHELVTISPAEFVEDCRAASLVFLQQHTAAGVTSVEGLINIPLFALGASEPSHWACVRKAYCDEVRAIRDYLASLDQTKFAGRAFSMTDSPEYIRSRSGIYCGEFLAFVAYLGLEVR